MCVFSLTRAGVCFVGQVVTSDKAITGRVISLQGGYKTIVQSLNPFRNKHVPTHQIQTLQHPQDTFMCMFTLEKLVLRISI